MENIKNNVNVNAITIKEALEKALSTETTIILKGGNSLLKPFKGCVTILHAHSFYHQDELYLDLVELPGRGFLVYNLKSSQLTLESHFVQDGEGALWGSHWGEEKLIVSWDMTKMQKAYLQGVVDVHLKWLKECFVESPTTNGYSVARMKKYTNAQWATVYNNNIEEVHSYLTSMYDPWTKDIPTCRDVNINMLVTPA